MATERISCAISGNYSVVINVLAAKFVKMIRGAGREKLAAMLFWMDYILGFLLSDGVQAH